MQTSLFVEDWLCFNNTLGEGAYGEVKLLINRKTEQKVACKIINHDKYKNAQTEILREVTIHKGLKHENIIAYLGRRQEPTTEYIFLEYAAGGELFQLIEPDIGMPSKSAQTYMKQLLCGVNYLHTRGIAHRDIKPENLLIDENGVLKISDFGMATIFRAKGKERLLDKKCGTKPYLAPEVLLKPYRAQPADLWSCGIVFVAMLTGELPWAQPSEHNDEFIRWKKDIYISETPWSKLGNTALSLARQILNVEPKSRLKLEQIEQHQWMRFNFHSETGVRNGDETDNRNGLRWHSLVEAETRHIADTPDVIQSQPLPSVRPTFIDQLITTRPEQFFFSQPTQNDNLMLQMTQSPITKDSFTNLIKRMTRFYVTVNYERALEILCNVLDKHHYNWSTDTQGIVTITTIDRMKNQLIFKINILEMDGKILIDFRLYKGCGLEFKKKFLKLKGHLCDIVDNN